MMVKSKTAGIQFKITMNLRPGPPIAAQLAAWDRLWRELAKPPTAPAPTLTQETDKPHEPALDS